ncbi:MAG: isoprenylcysteine carboxylmethyltransferase family protein [Candidatus Roizmanbacteria bacterium]|nr:MAG: isoprenylcysteine carboxylmethyltransferase family protein [Candidatus Roizmanbacteria bacterium]
MQKILIIILTSGIIILQIIWTITAPKRYWNIKRHLNLERLKTPFIVFISLIFAILSAFFFPLPQTSADGVLKIIGILLYVLGFFISAWAKLEMRSIWGLPGQHEIKEQNRIIKSGPFAFSRNPIYLGLMLVFGGYCLAIKSYAVFLMIIHLLIINKIVKKEEQLLEKHFGKDYIKYKNRVPRFI